MKKIIAGLMLVGAAALVPLIAQAQVSFSVSIAPPALPYYAQPEIPGDGYIWAPGYWSWNAGQGDYYWVPGTWVLAPYQGALWTPGYWGWSGGYYGWSRGYWGTHIGYYGGVNYGFGYSGVGYQGGYWNHGAFNYNGNVNNVRNINSTHIYNQRVTYNNTSRVSYNGGQGGFAMQPSKNEQRIAAMPHQVQTERQLNHENVSRSTETQRSSFNRGMPPVAATQEPGKFSPPNVQAARYEPAHASNQQHQVSSYQGGSHGGGGGGGAHRK